MIRLRLRPTHLTLKPLLAAAALLCAAASFAATEVNTASVAELDGVKGIGPSLSARILAERDKSHFTSWEDLMHRVKGIRGAAAQKLSAQGLTVNGAPFTPAQGRP